MQGGKILHTQQNYSIITLNSFSMSKQPVKSPDKELPPTAFTYIFLEENKLTSRGPTNAKVFHSSCYFQSCFWSLRNCLECTIRVFLLWK